MNLQDIYNNTLELCDLKSSGKKFIHNYCRLAHKNNFKPHECFDFLNEKLPANNFLIEELEKKFLEIESKVQKSHKRRKPTYYGTKTNEAMDDFKSFFKEGFDAYYDNILDDSFITDRSKGMKYSRINDRILNSLWAQFNSESSTHLSRTAIEQLLNSSQLVPKSNGIEKFMANLPKVKSKDYIKVIANSIVTTNQKMFEDRFKKWFIAMVATIVIPSVVNDLVLVLYGEQGLGKTKFFSRLLPDELSKYFVAKLPKLRDKDTEILMAENLLFVIDEIDTLNFKETSALKELISTQKVKVRKPYDKKQEEYKRYASFGGTTNKKQFLTDTTGTRRYLCFEVESVNQTVELPIKEAFAQALKEIEKGFQYWLDLEDIKVQEGLNEEFKFIEAEEELLVRFTRKPKKTDSESDISLEPTTIILQNLLKMADINRNIPTASVRKLGAALHKHGYPRKGQNGRKVWGYVLREIDELPKIEINTEPTEDVLGDDGKPLFD